ncbi:hypothetical protein [Arthrobacter sedimenti]|uniref:hypothetical protein n=1 Tax=Arthrobacter sedimenti TaxID=2694931 RepID=UPI000B353620|nr:hypothetical protein [Arthrobacter sedimenti]OUM41048.1 hypothetical protein B8W73_11875 [Arthrobacter agilis]
MLHFPSSSTAAHTAAPVDVHRLHQLLGDHIWAFSNCRVDAPGLQVAEVDWLFYNSVKGTFILSEWKRYPAPVSQVMDEGKPWVLRNGTEVPNPVEQARKQLDAVRWVVRFKVATEHFPFVGQQAINPYLSVYSPQVGPTTREERLRFGAVHGSLEELVETIERRYSPDPLVVPTEAGRMLLAEALADHFRCSISNAVRKKIAPPVPVAQNPQVRIAAIHRELAALHLELAALVDSWSALAATPVTLTPELVAKPSTAAPMPASKPSTVALIAAPKSPAVALLTAPVPQKAALPVSAPAKKTSPVNGHLQHHVIKHVPSKAAGPDHVRAAFLAALQDGQLRKSGVHVGQFGSLVGQRLEGNRNLASLALGSLVKWCLAQAAAAGIAAAKDAADPSIVRLKG